jgi:hypothetical protein
MGSQTLVRKSHKIEAKLRQRFFLLKTSEAVFESSQTDSITLFTTYSVPPFLRNKMLTNTGSSGEHAIRPELRACGSFILSSITDQFPKYNFTPHAPVPGTCRSTSALARYLIDKLLLFESSLNLINSHLYVCAERRSTI